MFARFQTKEEHSEFTDGLLKAMKMREEIAKLQVYQQMGFTTDQQIAAYETAKQDRLNSLNPNIQNNPNKRPISAISDPTDDSNMKYYNQLMGGETTTTTTSSSSTAQVDSETSLSTASSLVSPQESSLCAKLNLPPSAFLQLKTSLISEAVNKGFVKSGSVGKIGRVRVNVSEEQEKKVFEFCLTAGWINTN